jgi:hypothetical protein
MLPAMSYLALLLLLLLLLLARGRSTKLTPFMVQITQQEFVHNTKTLVMNIKCGPRFALGSWLMLQPRSIGELVLPAMGTLCKIAILGSVRRRIGAWLMPQEGATELGPCRHLRFRLTDQRCAP